MDLSDYMACLVFNSITKSAVTLGGVNYDCTEIPVITLQTSDIKKCHRRTKSLKNRIRSVGGIQV